MTPDGLFIDRDQVPNDLFGIVGDTEATARSLGDRKDPIVRVLRGETLSVDEVASRLDQPVGVTLARLLELELDSVVARAPGGLYRLRT